MYYTGLAIFYYYTYVLYCFTFMIIIIISTDYIFMSVQTIFIIFTYDLYLLYSRNDYCLHTQLIIIICAVFFKKSVHIIHTYSAQTIFIICTDEIMVTYKLHTSRHSKNNCTVFYITFVKFITRNICTDEILVTYKLHR